MEALRKKRLYLLEAKLETRKSRLELKEASPVARQPAQHAKPVVRSSAGFQSDQTRLNSGKEDSDLTSPQPLPHDYLAAPIHSVHLKDPLSYVQSNRRNVHQEPPPGLSLQSSRMGPFH